MNSSARAIATALVVILPAHVLLIISSAVAMLALLIYIEVVSPAVWSAKPARRKAAGAVLCQILSTWTGADPR
jgi:hypothetical protein